MSIQHSKSTDNTVFVRFQPPSPSITRFHVSDLFSQVGPLKKASIIRNAQNQGMGYGFCKFLSQQDAVSAFESMNGTSVKVEGQKYKLTVELASTHQKETSRHVKQDDATTTSKQPRKVSNDDNTTTIATDEEQERQLLLAKRKRTSRVIVRNVSFYAKEKDIRSTLEKEYGPIMELTLPRVSPKLHRGFCFVTFEREGHAQRAVQPRSSPLLIKKRPVAIDYAVSKHQHQQQRQEREKKKQQQQEAKDEENKEESSSDDDDSSSDSDDSSSDSDDDGEMEHTDNDEMEHADDKKPSKAAQNSNDDEDSSDSDSDDDDASETSSVDQEDESHEGPHDGTKQPPEHDDAVDAHRSLFCRNLPFDATRHDLFELFSPFGYIESIHLVKDKNTGVAKGTAFLAFRSVASAERALEAAGSSGFVTQREGSLESQHSSGLHLRGRRLFVDVAVDKKTAASLTVEKQGNKVTGKDKRNLYLKMEGRVANEADNASSNNNNAWENLPESDQLKRQRAFAEKNTKLRSPLFFINSNRLSVRNLAKHVDEGMLKKLCVIATRRGLETNLVTQEDQVAHWRASGDMTTRDIMKRIDQAKEEQDGSVIPVFDEGNVKRFIPSVFIDRDFGTNKKEKAPSRGFGFVDFAHHAHALACLRELNNNPYYSAEFVTGGKKAAEAKKQARKRKKTDLPKGEFVGQDGRALTPRLIVDFTVENKAKAKKQAEHRAQQLANVEKQRLELKEKKFAEGNGNKKQQKKKRRGAFQRERKRKQREALEKDGANQDSNAVDQQEEIDSSAAPMESEPRQKVKSAKPPKKKRKFDKDEQNFDNLVDSYRKAFTGVAEPKNETSPSEAVEIRPKKKKADKRWFE